MKKIIKRAIKDILQIIRESLYSEYISNEKITEKIEEILIYVYNKGHSDGYLECEKEDTPNWR